MQTQDVFRSIVESLHAHRLDDDRYRAKCPVHQGKSDSSLSIKLASNRVLLFCHARCEFRDIVTALGYKPGDMFADGRASPNQKVVQSAMRGLEQWRQKALLDISIALRGCDGLCRDVCALIELDDSRCEAWALLGRTVELRAQYDPIYRALNTAKPAEVAATWKQLSR